MKFVLFKMEMYVMCKVQNCCIQGFLKSSFLYLIFSNFN